jgi:Berberine and berberine like
VLNIAIQWSNATDDTRIFTAARNIINKSVALSKTLNVDHPFIYQNYAALEQDVFNSYGSANKERLLHIRSKYDPEQVFVKLQPGYFKLK